MKNEMGIEANECLNNFTKETYQDAVLTEAQIDRCTGCQSFTYDCSSGIAGCKKFNE